MSDVANHCEHRVSGHDSRPGMEAIDESDPGMIVCAATMDLGTFRRRITRGRKQGSADGVPFVAKRRENMDGVNVKNSVLNVGRSEIVNLLVRQSDERTVLSTFGTVVEDVVDELVKDMVEHHIKIVIVK